MGALEWTIVVLVVGARLLLPLTIPYVPLIGVISCLVLDAIDQTIFQQFPAIPLEGYQSYDKALDIYYLTITYLATFRNWTNEPAFGMSRFLFYYRLVGVAAFEFTGARALLFIFPNTFEYFFIFYEGVRARWNVARMGAWTVIVASALIWVFIKLPQEWWIHIAQLDMTDFIKEQLLGASLDESWASAITGAPGVVVAAAVIAGGLLALAYWLIRRFAPPADHGLRLLADALPEPLQAAEAYRVARVQSRVFDRALVEKIAFISLVSAIFVSMLPGLEAGLLQVSFSVTMFVVLNTAVSQWLALRGRGWRTAGLEFAAMAVVNFGLILGLEFLERIPGLRDYRLSLGATLFFAFLLTMLIVLFDRYSVVRMAREVLREDEEVVRPEPALT